MIARLAAIAAALLVATASGRAGAAEPEAMIGPAPTPAVGDGDEDTHGGSSAARRPLIPPGPHFVFAHQYSLTFGLNAIPSGDVSFLFGHALAGDLQRRRWALGYQATLSIGGADRYFRSLFSHRHHAMAVSYGGLLPRLYAAVGGGMAVFESRPSVAEFEGRVGYLFGGRRPRRVAGVVGALARLGWNAASLEKAPVPQVGAFLGLVLR